MPQSSVLVGDALALLTSIPDDTFDAVVTDPPYGLSEPPPIADVLRAWLEGREYVHAKRGFMGKEWDSFVPSPMLWAEVLRVLKPGGHALVFAGSRTQDVMGLALRMAGFEIRDTLMWVYGSGFPKSLDISKALDKAAGAEREVVAFKGGRFATPKHDFRGGAHHAMANRKLGMFNEITAPATEEAQHWQGWGTALKPAYEPIILVRKPLIGTLVQNVQAHGVGGLNIDGCRVETEDELTTHSRGQGYDGPAHGKCKPMPTRKQNGQDLGRWPANLVHDGSEEVVELFPQTASNSGNLTQKAGVQGVAFGKYGAIPTKGITDSGSAARFFYAAKASVADREDGLDGFAAKQQDTGRNEGDPGGDNPRNRGARERRNHHPTVKPTELMRWLVRLVTPPGGTVLDPFTGSGSTGRAAVLEGFDFMGVELDEDYVEIAKARIQAAIKRSEEDR